MLYNRDKDVQIFVNKLPKLSSEEFLALAQLLTVKLSVVDKETGEYTVRDAEEIINECIAIFRKLPHKARKAILKAMSKVGGKNGTTSEHPTQE